MSRILRFLKDAVEDQSGFGVTEYGTVLSVATILVVVFIVISHSKVMASMAADSGLIPQIDNAQQEQTAAAGETR